MLLMIDNYDSFTYTLVNYFQALGQDVLVKRNDEVSISEINDLDPTQIVISPGPCSPNEAGLSNAIVANFYTKKPILGVCLGHQIIAQHFGAKVVRAPRIMHGKTSVITHKSKDLFADLPSPMTVTRYHSLIVQPETMPSRLETIAWVTDDSIELPFKEVMALSVKDYPVMGVQFHPESVMSENGLKLLNNFIQLS